MQVKHFVGIFIISVGLGQALALPSNHSSLLIKRRACASEEIQNRDPGVNPISCTFDCGIEGPCCTLAGNDVCYGKSDFQPCNNNDMECTNKWCADGTCLDPDPAVTRGRWVGQACKVGDNCASGTCDTGVCVDNAQCGSKASCATGEICHENECLEGALTVGRNCKTDLQCDNLSCWKEICRIPSDVDDPCTENNSCLDGLTCNLDTLKCIEGGGPVPAEIGGDCEANEGCNSGYCNLSNLKCEERPDTKTENGRDCSSNDECNSNFCSPEGKCADQTVEPVDPPNPNPDTDTGTEPGNGGDPEDPDTGGDSSQPIIVQPVVIIQTETRNGAPVTVTRTTSPGSTRAAVSGSSRASVTARVAASGGDRRWEIPLASELMGLAVAAIGLAMGAVGVVLI